MVQQNPRITQNILNAPVATTVTDQRILIIGQKQTSGTAPEGLSLNVANRENPIDTLFGARSQVAQLLNAARSVPSNESIPIDVIAYNPNSSGVAATGSVAFSGSASSAGTVVAFVAGLQVSFSVTSGATAENIASLLASGVTSSSSVPVTAAASTSTVTFTSANAGTTGNDLTIAITQLPAGVTATITAMNGGATDPTITNLSTLMDGRRWQGVGYPSTWDLPTIEAIMNARFNVDNDIQNGVVFVGRTDTISNLTALATSTNSQSVVVFGNRSVNDSDYRGGGQTPSNNDHVAGVWLGIRAVLLSTQRLNVNRLTASSAAAEQFSGNRHATLPYMNTPLDDYLHGTVVGKGFTTTEINTLRVGGITTIGLNSGDLMTMGQMVTTYRTDASGNADDSFFYLNVVDTMSVVREHFVNFFRSAYSQRRVAAETSPNSANITTEIVRSDCISQYKILANDDNLVTRAGTEALNNYVNGNPDGSTNGLTVTPLTDGTGFTVNHAPPINTQLRNLLGNITTNFRISAGA